MSSRRQASMHPHSGSSGRLATELHQSSYNTHQRSFSVSKLSDFHHPGPDEDADDDVTESSVYLPSDDSFDDEEDAEAELWAPDGMVRPELRGTLTFPDFLEDDQLAHICIGIDIGTAVHEVSYLLHAPAATAAAATAGDKMRTGVPPRAPDAAHPFVTKKFGFHLHASLCVERSRRRPNGDADASGEGVAPLSSPSSEQRGKLVRLDSVFSVDFDDSGDGGQKSRRRRSTKSRRAVQTPNDLAMLPFNKRALLESLRTDFSEDNPVRLWMATYSEHEPQDAFIRACQELARVARDYLVRFAPGTLEAKGNPEWAKALDTGYTCDAICYTLPLPFARVESAATIVQTVDDAFAARAENQHALLVVTHLLDMYAAILYYAVNLRKSRAVLGDKPNETGFLLDFGHGFTSCVAFQLHQPAAAAAGGTELNSVDILSEHSIDVGYADVVHAVMTLVVERYESIFETPPQIWQYLAMFEVCRTELKSWATELREQIEAYTRRHRRSGGAKSQTGGKKQNREGKGVLLDDEDDVAVAGIEDVDYWSRPESWRKSARRNLNYHISSSRLLRFKAAWADFTLNLTGKEFFRVARPYFKRMVGVASRTFRNAHFEGDRAPALLFASNSYAEVPIFHELLNLKLKKLVKGFFKEQDKRHTRSKPRHRDQRGHDRVRAQAIKRLEKICLGRSAVAQGAAVCATLMKDLHIDEHFATGAAAAAAAAAPVPSSAGPATAGAVGGGSGGQLDELPISSTPELPFCRLVPEGHHFHPWAPVAMHLVQRTQWHIQRSAAEAMAEERAAAAEDAALEGGEVANLLRTPLPARRMSPTLSPFGNHKLHVGLASRSASVGGRASPKRTGGIMRSHTTPASRGSISIASSPASVPLPTTSTAKPQEYSVSRTLGYDMDVQISERLHECQNKPQIREGAITMQCITWNVGNACPRPTEISDLLVGLDKADLLVFAAQEAVWNKKKSPKKHNRKNTVDGGGGGGNGVGHESESTDDEIDATIARSESAFDELDLDADFVTRGTGEKTSDPFAEMVSHRAALVGFQVVRVLAMGEIRLLVHARKNLADSGRISEIEAVCVPTGVAGVGTNKGGVVLKMNIDDTSFAFVSSHLAAHLKHVEARNQNFRQILKAASVGNMDLDFDCQFHHVVWLGDLNYRVNLRAAEGKPTPPSKGPEHDAHWKRVHNLVRDAQWTKLMNADQLKAEQKKAACFVGFTEGNYNFLPTFKVKRQVGVQYTTQRVPSFCDRILWQSLPGPTPANGVITNRHIQLLKLENVPAISTSDHKPVRGVLVARLFKKIRNDTMPALPSSDSFAGFQSVRGSGGGGGGGATPDVSRGRTASQVRRQSSNSRFAEAAVRTAVVRFSRMQAKGLKPADLNGKSDPYLKFHAVPFRDYLIKSVYVSKKKKATLNPEWKNTDVPELATVLRNNGQLNELVIAISVWDHDVSSPDDPLGDVLIPIGNFLPPDADPEACSDIPPQKFKKRITLHGQQVHNGSELGYLRGMVSVTWQWDAGFAGDDKRDTCTVQ